MCCSRQTNPKHSLLWFSIDGLSYSESAQRGFVPYNYRECDFSTNVCLASSSVIVKEIWWRYQARVSEGQHGRAITPLCLPRVSEGWCHPGREQKRRALVNSSTSVFLSLRTCYGEEMITGMCVEFSGHAALQISLAILHGSRCSNRFHAGLCLVLSSGWHSDLINIHACQMN